MVGECFKDEGGDLDFRGTRYFGFGFKEKFGYESSEEQDFF